MKQKLLIYGIGNPARQDDGFGTEVLQQLQNTLIHPNIHYHCNYQLNIEDAELFTHYQHIILIDASQKAGGLSLSRLEAENNMPISSHALSPQQVLALSLSLYQAKYKCWIVTTTGTQWGLGQELSQTIKSEIKPACLLIHSHISSLGYAV